MKVILCCNNCGNEDLMLFMSSNPYIYKCTECNTIFNIEDSGFNIFENGSTGDAHHTFDGLYSNNGVIMGSCKNEQAI